MPRILCIDGGGVKGAFPAAFLATIEDTVGMPVGTYFDLVVGTSTGGIIALGLGLGFSAKQIQDFYVDLGPTLFGRSALLNVLRSLRQTSMSKYGSRNLRRALEALFGERTLGESQLRLVIPSFNIETGEVHFFKTRHNERFDRDYKLSVVDIALATSAAPTYFPTHRLQGGNALVDGGVWANNPVSIAVAEALGVLEWQVKELNILSLGCTQEPFDAGWAINKASGLFYWGRKAAGLFMTAQSSGSLGLAATLIGHQQLCRVNPVVPRRRFSIDKASAITSLIGLGSSEARKALPELRKTFFESPAAPFEPYS
jgi:hypothetical protein